MRYVFTYTGVRVRDLPKALRFYTNAMGMKKIGGGTMPHRGKYVHLQGPGSDQRLELNWYPRGTRFYTPYRKGEELDHLAFRVRDVEAAFEELVANGARPAVPPARSEGTEVYVKDLDGIWIELLG